MTEERKAKLYFSIAAVAAVIAIVIIGLIAHNLLTYFRGSDDEVKELNAPIVGMSEDMETDKTEPQNDNEVISDAIEVPDPLVVDTAGLEEAPEVEETSTPALMTEDEVIADEKAIEEKVSSQQPVTTPASDTPKGGDVKYENGEKWVYNSRYGWMKSEGENKVIKSDAVPSGEIIGN